jgi:hypothetical protein
MIRKIGPRKFRLFSRKTKHNLGTFRTRKAAQKHEREVQYFKRLKRL